MAINRLPSWFIVGILIYPLLVLVGLIFSLATSGDFNFMYWLAIPSMMFNQLFKECCTAVAENQILILISGFIFWFIIGAILGLFVKIVGSAPIISDKEVELEIKRQEEQDKPKEEPKPEDTKETSSAENVPQSTETVEAPAEVKIEEPKVEETAEVKKDSSPKEAKEVPQKEEKKEKTKSKPQKAKKIVKAKKLVKSRKK